MLLNGLIQPFQQPERVIGFFSTYRNQYPVSRDLLRDIAGQYHNWVTNRSVTWDGTCPSSTRRLTRATNSSSPIPGLKFRAKHLVRRIDSTRRYEVVSNGLKTLTALTVLRDNVMKPLLAAAEHAVPTRGAQNPTALDHHYEALRVGMHALFHELGVAA